MGKKDKTDKGKAKQSSQPCPYQWETGGPGSPQTKHWCRLTKGHSGGHPCKACSAPG